MKTPAKLTRPRAEAILVKTTKNIMELVDRYRVGRRNHRTGKAGSRSKLFPIVPFLPVAFACVRTRMILN